MKILGASSSTHFDARDERALLESANKQGVVRYGADQEGANTSPPMAIEPARDAVLQALAQAGLEPAQIELILALSLSPSRLADDPGFSYPRLSHPSQRDLDLSNAVVFDMMDADWAIALDLAQSFCRGLGYRHALVVRGECLDDVIGAQAQGLANGAAAIVIECAADDDDAAGAAAHFAHADIDHPPLMALKTLGWEAIRDTGRYARVAGGYDADLQRFDIDPARLQAPISALLDGLPEASAQAPRRWFCERWMGPGLALGDTESAAPPAAAPPAGPAPAPMFELPHFLASLLRERAAGDGSTETLIAFTLDPFKSRIGCFAVEV